MAALHNASHSPVPSCTGACSELIKHLQLQECRLHKDSHALTQAAYRPTRGHPKLSIEPYLERQISQVDHFPSAM